MLGVTEIGSRKGLKKSRELRTSGRKPRKTVPGRKPGLLIVPGDHDVKIEAIISDLVQRIAAQNPNLFRRDVEKAAKAIVKEVMTGLVRGSVFPAKKKSSSHTGRTARAGPQITEQSVYDQDGRLTTVFTVDAGSATLGSDLRYAFEKSVARARRENKKKFGSADAHVQKG